MRLVEALGSRALKGKAPVSAPGRLCGTYTPLVDSGSNLSSATTVESD
jgi:hypothetical protein